jgi:hypothetical protein
MENKLKLIKNSCGKKGCYITLLPVLIKKENLEKYKKAA